jgi:calcineurin-like phosphoesterase
MRFEVAKREPLLCAVVVTVDAASGRAEQIERVQIVDYE